MNQQPFNPYAQPQNRPMNPPSQQPQFVQPPQPNQNQYFAPSQREPADPFIARINYLKSKVIETQEIEHLKQKDISAVFPGVPSEKYKEILESEKIGDYLFKLPEFKKLAEYVLELVDNNEKLAYDLTEKNTQLQRQREDLIELANYFDAQKQELQTKQIQCNLIQEVMSKHLFKRFEKTKILSHLESEINHLDEQSSEQLEGMEGSVVVLQGKEEKNKFEEDVLKYLELRKKYHRLVIKKEKFAEVM